MTPDARGEGQSDEIVHVDTSGVPTHKRRRRPFLEANTPLETLLLDGYLGPALRWLLGGESSEIPAMRVGSNWEVALTLTAALEVRRRFDGEATLARQFPRLTSQIEQMRGWLASKAELHSDGSACWDHSAWDTGTVTRALAGITVTGSYVDLAAMGPPQRAAVDGGLRWLIRRYVDYSHDTVQAALNPAEIAQIGLTVVELAMQDVSDVANALAASGWPSGIDSLCRSLVDVLLRRQSERPLSPSMGGRRTSEIGIWWDDWFGSCDVLMFFVRLLDLNAARALTIEPDMLMRTRESIARCFTLIEDSQSDGIWGAYLDTIAVVGTYVRVASAVSASVTPSDATPRTAQPRIVFRTIRWLCDPTQISNDGSILHTGFLTTAFVNTLIQVIHFWPETKMTLIDLYDELTQVMDRGVTIDRANFLTASIERDATMTKLAHERRRSELLVVRLAHEHWFRARFVLTIVIGVVTLVLALALPVAGSLAQVSYKIEDAAVFVSVLAVLVAAFGGLATVVWMVDRPPDIES